MGEIGGGLVESKKTAFEGVKGGGVAKGEMGSLSLWWRRA